MEELILTGFAVLFGGLAVVLIFADEWLRDQPPYEVDREPVVRCHEPSRVVRVAPERAEVQA